MTRPNYVFSGVEGGFDLGEAKYEIEEVNTITVLPDWTEIPLNSSELPGEVGCNIYIVLCDGFVGGPRSAV